MNAPIPLLVGLPEKISSGGIKVPENVKVGDIILARYNDSRWARKEDDWHHAAIVSKVDPLTVIEASGVETGNQSDGPAEVEFDKAVGFGGAGKSLIRLKFLRPIFPNPIREIDSREVPRSERKIISEEEARSRAVEFARAQIGEPYKLSGTDLIKMSNESVDLFTENSATKWDENEWYCSLLVFKAYSRTITGMYLESYGVDENSSFYEKISSGFFVKPDDIQDSKNSEGYFTWTRQIEL